MKFRNFFEKLHWIIVPLWCSPDTSLCSSSHHVLALVSFSFLCQWPLPFIANSHVRTLWFLSATFFIYISEFLVITLSFILFSCFSFCSFVRFALYSVKFQLKIIFAESTPKLLPLNPLLPLKCYCPLFHADSCLPVWYRHLRFR